MTSSEINIDKALEGFASSTRKTARSHLLCVRSSTCWSEKAHDKPLYDGVAGLHGPEQPGPL